MFPESNYCQDRSIDRPVGTPLRPGRIDEPTALLLPAWSIMHSRHWKMQIPYLARHGRVLTFDGRGNGRSDRPTEPEAYRSAELTADALAVMDATGTERAALVASSDIPRRAASALIHDS
jgi:pimeloyl-ACP methyl ester carboxylesterase